MAQERYLFDTQAVVLAHLDEFPLAWTRLNKRNAEWLLSTVSIVEIAIKSARGSISMTEADVAELIRNLNLKVIPFELRHANRLFSLPVHHKDPFDRMIIATALEDRVPLVSGGRAFTMYKGLRLIGS